MELSSENTGGAVIVQAVGRVDGSNARDFHEGLEASIGADGESMVLDFEGLSYISQCWSARGSACCQDSSTTECQAGGLLTFGLDPGSLRDQRLRQDRSRIRRHRRRHVRSWAVTPA